MQNMKLQAIRQITGRIILKSGLHIGAGNMEMRIGGTDSPVIKHPHTQEPYIPGSSVKGKVRSLVELAFGLVPFAHKDGGVTSLKTYRELEGKAELKKQCEKVLKVFGYSPSDQEKDKELAADLGPTRVSFADCSLNKDWKTKAVDNHWALTEVKSENSIDRIQGAAQHPRFIERVPAGCEFDFRVSFRILEDADKELFNDLLSGLKLLELDALGGSGSRGYGRIEFADLNVDGEPIKEKFDQIKPFAK
ncbi:MAG TPA: type III-A CRISPR-associated RAMP protein Csm3 [Candidatus Ozemobacteraceae bacterium]|nr:type III-A CRISPR-associated RAMP protein Csm3 [Candidatus Ozemobacteraceae bacterium]